MSNVYARYRHAFADALAASAGLTAQDILPQIKDAEPAHGDFAFPAFALAKTLKKAPPAIAAELAGKVSVPGLEVKAVGPYVNAKVLPSPFFAEVLGDIKKSGKSYGSSSVGAGKTVVMDYSSPNIAKPIAFHHIRSTVIGHAIANLHRSQGYKVQGINYLGDWGKQFGLVAVGFKAFGNPEKKNDIGHLVEVYIKANERANNDPAFDEEARAFFRKMEQNDPDALALWKEFRDASLGEFEKVYARLGVTFESFEGESRYQGKMDAVIDEIGKTVGVKESEGALIVDMPYADNEPPVLLKKNDGSTLYATRDLAAAEDRYARFGFERSLYVVATDQSLHFRQVFEVLKRMGKAWAERCVHVNFGRVHGMSTRKGNVVLLTDVLDEAKARALEKVKENLAQGRVNTQDPEALAEQIGLGAVVFGDLRNRRTSDYTFDWDDVLSFEGHTGPYLQYAHARACKVIQKGGGVPKDFDPARLVLDEERDVIRMLARFPDAVDEAVRLYEPSIVGRHLLEIASVYSRYYTAGNQDKEKRVLVENDDALRAARLALTDATRWVLVAGMSLLGVPTPEEM